MGPAGVASEAGPRAFLEGVVGEVARVGKVQAGEVEAGFADALRLWL